MNSANVQYCQLRNIFSKQQYLVIIKNVTEKGDIRITGNYGTTYGVGRVEMRMESEWYSLCATSFSNDDAGVVCRQLGFNG